MKTEVSLVGIPLVPNYKRKDMSVFVRRRKRRRDKDRKGRSQSDERRRQVPKVKQTVDITVRTENRGVPTIHAVVNGSSIFH